MSALVLRFPENAWIRANGLKITTTPPLLPPTLEEARQTSTGLRQLLEARFGDDFKVPTFKKAIINHVISSYRGSVHTPWTGANKKAADGMPFPCPTDLTQALQYIGDNEGLYEFAESQTTDSFMWMDRKYRVSMQILEALKIWGRGARIVTRSDLVGHDDYLEVYPKDTTVYFLVDHTKESHPGAPSVKRLLTAGERIDKAGYEVIYCKRGKGRKRDLVPLTKFELKKLRDENGSGKCSYSDSTN